MQDSKQEATYFSRYETLGHRAFAMKATCACCGGMWAEHIGLDCQRGGTSFIPRDVEDTPKRVETLGDLLQRALNHRWSEACMPAPTNPALDATFDANAAMIARDGPAKPKCGCQQCRGTRGGVPGNENRLNGVVLCDYCTADAIRATPTAKPAISGLQREYSSTHLLGSYR